MSDQNNKPTGPDFAEGIAPEALGGNGVLLGQVGGEEVLLVRRGAEIFAISAHCTHYHGPLADGLVTGGSIRCPWHHACFDLKTGEAMHAPAFAPLSCWKVEQRDGKIFVGEKMPEAKKKSSGTGKPPGRI
ncbi:MAG TPA: Rieske 2Fe-2S domain-containing protein, partial [Rhizomicrobium sp.]|nr:Rieske 2Fe-2S domain-containing protein [Rhizomicrobium sp.]